MVDVDIRMSAEELAKEFVGRAFVKRNSNGTYDYMYIVDFTKRVNNEVYVKLYQVWCQSEGTLSFSYDESWLWIRSFASAMEAHEECNVDELIGKVEAGLRMLYDSRHDAETWLYEHGIKREAIE